MKKLTLSIGLAASILYSNAQDTTEVSVTKKHIYYWVSSSKKCDHYYLHKNNISFKVKENELLRLHLYDKEERNRKLITIKGNDTTINIVPSKDYIYYSPLGPLKLEIK